MGMCRRILVVYDERQVIFLSYDALTRLRSERDIPTAENGGEALQNVRQMPIDLVITDPKLPGVDSLAPAQGIKTLHPGKVAIWSAGYRCREVRARPRLGMYRPPDKPVGVGERRQIAPHRRRPRRDELYPNCSLRDQTATFPTKPDSSYNQIERLGTADLGYHGTGDGRCQACPTVIGRMRVEAFLESCRHMCFLGTKRCAGECSPKCKCSKGYLSRPSQQTNSSTPGPIRQVSWSEVGLLIPGRR